MTVSNAVSLDPPTGDMEEIPKPVILAIALLRPIVSDNYWEPFNDSWDPFTQKLLRHANLVLVRRPERALSALQRCPPPQAVLIIDDALVMPEMDFLWYAILSYVHQGGIAVAMGMFEDAAYWNESLIDSFFSKAGLGWKASGLGHFANLNHNAFNIPAGLPKTRNQVTVHLTKVEDKDSWYVGIIQTSDHIRSRQCVQPQGRRSVAVALGRVGNGKVGYIGGYELSRESTGDIILAMCGFAL